MKFPGKRKLKHFFPVDSRQPGELYPRPENLPRATHICGIDQILVDIDAQIDDDFLARYQLSKGQSCLISDHRADELYRELRERNLINSQNAGGTIGNTLHNYSVLADDPSVLFGVMSEQIAIGTYAYRYLCNTSSRVDLNYLQPVPGAVGRCFTLISPDGERTFAISGGMMNHLRPESIDQAVVQQASALVICAYTLLRSQGDETIHLAVERAVELANEANVPVVLTLGTRFIIEQAREQMRDFIAKHVTVLAMNEEEAEALTGESDPLLACDKALELTDLVLCTAGAEGLYLAGYTDHSARRETSHQLVSSSIGEYNRYEFSRPMRKVDCALPEKIYTHIAPFMGGPSKIKNTNGAGDGALAALLHDLAANDYHQLNVPDSAKHTRRCLGYSSLAQVAKYCNRVSYEVLVQHAPRLTRGLPEQEDCLEEAYWAR